MTRIACHQLAPVLGDLEGNRARAAAAIEAAAAAGADVVVLPELVTSGYVFEDAREARPLAEPAGGPTLAGWAALAAEHDLVIAGGFPELADDGTLYNSAALVDRTGVRAVYRKAHLWDREPECFRPGDRPPARGRHAARPDRPDGLLRPRVPRWVRSAALAGAELLCVPTNWPAEPRPAGERPMEVMKAMVHAATNRMAVACCDRCGTERGVAWVSGTVICGPDGWLRAGPPGPEPALLLADVDLAGARDKALGPRNDVFGDRRPALY